MDTIALELAQRLVNRLDIVLPDDRLLAGICGIPASGKSSLSLKILSHVNALLEQSNHQSRAILVNQDGWHLTRQQLSAMPDPKLAFDRRGAHWTFDAASYLTFIRSLRVPISANSTPHPIITAPGFDHILKDPSPHAVTIHPHHRIVLIEGLYTFLNIEIWREAAALLDERWFIDVDEGIARRRLVDRHIATQVASDRSEAQWRADENDFPSIPTSAV